MQNRSFVFNLTNYDNDLLLPQAAKALELRTDLISRERMPGLWKITDKLNPGGKKPAKNNARTIVLSVLCLLLGIFLFIPGLMKPKELAVPLFAGALAIGAGIGGFIRSGKNKKDPFERSAAILLEGKDTAFDDKDLTVEFIDAGMIIPGDDGIETVSFDEFERAIETEDLLLLIYGTRVTALQKKDLISQNAEELADFLMSKLQNYHKI